MLYKTEISYQIKKTGAVRGRKGNEKRKKTETFYGGVVRQASNAKDVKHYTTERLREEFHIANLFTKDNVRMVYSHIDRILTAGLMPVRQTLKLEAGKELAAEYFLQRREMGCINIGGKGIITVDGVEYEMNPRDGIYIGMGNKEITFKSCDETEPAKFYVSSCPAHTAYPTVKIDIIATPQTAPLRERQADGSRHPFDSFIIAKTPAARWGEAEDLAGPAVFLASEASNFVNGHILYVDGGILAYIGKQPK